MRRLLAIALGSIVLTLALAGSALAAEPESRKAPPVTKYDFDEDHVIGDVLVPEGDYFDGKGSSKHSSLIRVRTQFVAELFRSVNDI